MTKDTRPRQKSATARTSAAQGAPVLERGTRVHVWRDETRFPSKGTWPGYRGRIGTVVSIMGSRTGSRTGREYGVAFSRGKQPKMDAWFQPYELVQIEP